MRLSTLIAGLLITCSTAYAQQEVQVYSLAEIDSVRLHYGHLQFAMKLPAHTDSITDTPLYRLVFQRMKKWSDTDALSWDDFIPVSADETGSNSTVSFYASDMSSLFEYRNTDYPFRNLVIYVRPSYSYYDPIRADEWDLRYNQVLFDMAELSAREAVTAYNKDNTKGDIKDLYERIFEERKQAFNNESRQGKDTAVISDYENRIRVELRKSPREYTPQEFGYTPGRATTLEFGGHIGYLNKSIIGNGSEYLKPANGYTFGVEIGTGGFKFEGEFYALRYGKLKQPDFYHDNSNGYDWTQDKEVQEAGIRFKTGYTLFSNEYVRFTPVIGTSLGSLTQKSDKKYKEGSFMESKLPGNRGFLIGLDTDWIIWRHQDSTGLSFQGLRFSVYGMRHNYEKNLGKVWSLNLGIAFITCD